MRACVSACVRVFVLDDNMCSSLKHMSSRLSVIMTSEDVSIREGRRVNWSRSPSSQLHGIHFVPTPVV